MPTNYYISSYSEIQPPPVYRYALKHYDKFTPEDERFDNILDARKALIEGYQYGKKCCIVCVLSEVKVSECVLYRFLSESEWIKVCDKI